MKSLTNDESCGNVRLLISPRGRADLISI